MGGGGGGGVLTCNSYGEGDVDRGEQPEQDDGEQPADGEEDEGAAAVDDGADEEEEAKHRAQAQQRHAHRPPHRLNTIHTEIVGVLVF